MVRRVGNVIVVVLAVVGVFAIVGLALVIRGGIGTRHPPSTWEAALARRVRSLAIPTAARLRANPEVPSAAALRSGLEHFADHCASCHGNDGRGDTAMGRALYPRVPDMRQRPTQGLTDGELFYVIEHGVKLTGMPAWGTGTPEGESASWHLVQFIRHLPKLTETELEEMRSLNPRTAEEWRHEEEMRRFLDGDDSMPTVPSSHDHHGAHR